MAENETVLLTAAQARTVAEQIFQSVGMRPADASAVTDSLVWADLRGIASHGLARVPSYVQRLERGALNPRPEVRITASLPAARVIDGDRGPGQLAVSRAMREAIDLARTAATGLVAVRGCGHTGAAGYFTQMAATQGMIGIYVGGSRPSMAYHGTRSKSAATNPLSIAVPATDGGVLCLDMATSNAGVGKLRHHRATGTPLQPGWALDAAGAPTTDPEQAAVLTPAAGPKGSGMSLLFECVTSLLVGNALIAPALLGQASGPAQNALVMAIDISFFRDLDGYRADIGQLTAALKAQPRAAGTEAVLMPGERGDTTMAHRRQHGIPLPARTWGALRAVAERLGVRTPL